MLEGFYAWLDDRTGYRRWTDLLRQRTLARPSFLYSTGSCVLWMLVVMIVTGLLMMLRYDPSVSNAWASVHYLEQTTAGRLLRGIHFYSSQALLILVALHTIRVLITGAFRPPRELVWASGLLLLPVVIFWAISGNPLCWDQEGYGQIEVEGNIIASTPVVGPFVRQLLIGGAQPGNLTLTGLYALHVAYIPLVAGLLLALHLTQLVRHGSSTSGENAAAPAIPYWPHQSWRNAVSFAAIFSAVAYLAWHNGATLGFPADTSLPSHPRPEWYFLFLFELRGYFTGPREYIATVILPIVVLAVLLFVPALDRVLPRWPARALRGLVVAVLVIGFAGLTARAVHKDRQDAPLQASLRKLDELAHRARELADANGIPPEGAAALLRNDPPTRGPLLFAEHCAHCHCLGPEFTTGVEAADLTGFGSKEWIGGLVQDPGSERFFGRTGHEKMIEWRDETFEALADEERAEVELACQWLATKPRGVPKDDDTESPFARGYNAFNGYCIECHRYQEEGGTNVRGPDFTGYGDVDWLVRIISDPAHRDLYGKKATMPAFQEKLSESEIQLLAGWLFQACGNAPPPVPQP